MGSRFWAILLPPLGWLVIFVALPTIAMVFQALNAEGLEHIASETTRRLIGRSLWISALATAICAVIGYPVAWFIARCGPRWRAFLLFLIIVPLFSNLVVRSYAMLFLLRPMDLHYTAPAVVIGIVYNYLPFMILPLYSAIEKLPPQIMEAARDLGAPPWRAFLKVALPLTAPGIAAGVILVFIPALGSFAIPELIGGTKLRMLGCQIDHHIRTGNASAGMAQTLVLLAASIGLTWLYHRLRPSEGLV